MRLVVQTFGGDAVATLPAVRRVAGRVARTHHAGHRILLVVSASSEAVDGLLDLAARVGVARPAREVDQLLAAAGCASAALLALALRGLGVPAMALSGEQAGLLVTGAHGAGAVAAVRPARVRRLLWRRVVVVVAGAQGLDAGGDIVTLGADGSRATAAALVAALAGRDRLVHPGEIHADETHGGEIHMGLTEGACHGAQRLVRTPCPAAAPASLPPPPPPRRVGSGRTG